MMELVIGASASGKSEFAEERLCRLADENDQTKFYIATMQPFGEEALTRIQKHQRHRADRGMITIEQPVFIANAVCKMQTPSKGKAVIVECMSNLMANEMFAENAAHCSKPAEKIMKDLLKLYASCENLVIVSNDVFSDGRDYDPSTMEYITQLGNLNCLIARQADCVWEVICGIPVLRKGNKI